jgi:Tol biopolymer transport system component/Iap family predicted aminopeptidase
VHKTLVPLLGLVALSCAGGQPPDPSAAGQNTNVASNPTPAALPEEVHLADLRRLTQGGQNAEAYWSFDGKQLSFQARHDGEQCDRIFRINPEGGSPMLVSTGKGATTCSHFLPRDQELIYASTHLGGEACPPRPDLSKGYVWALYKDYDIFRVRADGSGLVRLTDTPGYDAEGTVCAKDGSIVFTSVRDGDLDLYRMDADGKNVQRLTNTPGYDGGAFFNADCTKIVWRASRPKPGPELDEYRRLLAQGLVKPTQLEIWVANADGSDAQQITYLGAASFAPFFFPDGRRVIFSSNYGDAQGREFDLWAVNIDGTGLERITFAPGFDGFPMFSPDGKRLAFSSNRAFPPGVRQTDVYVARWIDGPPRAEERPPDRIRTDVAWLADPKREGRGIGSAGLEASGAYLERRMGELGLAPAGDEGKYRQVFEVPVSVRLDPSSSISMGGLQVRSEAFTSVGFSASGSVEGPLVLAGYGIADPHHGRDDYANVNVRGRIALVRRFVPDQDPKFSSIESQRRFGDLRYKAWVAREHGAKGLIVVDWPETRPLPEEARFPSLQPEGAEAGIPVAVVKREAVERVMPLLVSGKRVNARMNLALKVQRRTAFNVIGRVAAGAKNKLPGAVLVGAHYDHLGMGGRYSLAPDRQEVHPGADDNASGVAGILEAARALAARSSELLRDVIFAAFSGEETGVLGSSYFARSKAMQRVLAMLNLDMVGRLRQNRLNVLGAESAEEWASVVDSACAEAAVECALGGEGYGPSDQTPFYAAGVPVLHFFTGAHSDYHKPSDLPERINAAGAAQVAQVVARVAQNVAVREERLTYRAVPSPAPLGDRRTFGASLGTIPDYGGTPHGEKGMLLSGVRTGGAADLAGMRRGDILVRVGKHPIGGVEDLMYVLESSKPGETVGIGILRDGKELVLEATFQEARRR